MDAAMASLNMTVERRDIDAAVVVVSATLALV